jgi:hypothetical protein
MKIYFAAAIVVLLILHKCLQSAINRTEPYTDDENFSVKPSKISGLGVFSVRGRKEGDLLLPAISEKNRVTSLGSKVNHCWLPNSRLVLLSDGRWWLVATRDLNRDEEVTSDYRLAPPFVRQPKDTWTC